MIKWVRCKRHIRAFEFLVLSFTYSSVLLAQVTIKEAVTIKPIIQENGKAGRGARMTNSITSGFVMTKKGVVQMFYGGAQRLHSVVPTNAKLVVHRLRVDT